MILLPAIDILGGNCVRLYKGEYDTARRVAVSAEETVKEFCSKGAEYIHTVDLDGAKSGECVNRKLFYRLAEISSVPIELGGGIRNIETVKDYLEHGISRIILGSAAVTDREFLKRAADLYADRIAVGIDAKDGRVAVSGWTEDSGTDYIDFAKEVEALGIKNIIFTDISKDGTLEGPSVDMLQRLSDETDCGITASGGIKTIDDIKTLCGMNLYGAITGRAVYDGTLDLEKAVKLTKSER